MIYLKWEDVKKAYVDQWVLIAALEAHSENEERIIDDMSVIDATGSDSLQALSKYKELHREDKNRELYVVHTSRKQLDIKEKTWIGVRR